MAICTKCKLDKEESEFNKDKSKKLGRSSQCKECLKLYLKKWREDPDNKERNKKNIKEWREKNETPELRRKYWSKYWECEEVRKEHYARMAKWRKENPERIKEYQQKNKNKLNKNRRRRWYNDLNFRLRSNIRTRIYQAIKNKSNSSFKLLGCKINFYIKYLEQQFDENMSWDNYGTYWEIDHIKPLSKGGSFHYTNTQPLNITENRIKSNKF